MNKNKRVTGYKKRKRPSKKYVSKKKSAMVKPIAAKNFMERPLGGALPVSMQYLSDITLNAGIAGVADTHVYRLASIFDPDLTGTGHQPLGHDQLEGIYERYQVYKVDFYIAYANTDEMRACRVGYRMSDLTSTSNDPRVNIENGQGEWKLLSREGGGQDIGYFRGSIYLNKIHNISYKQYMANDDYGSNFGTNPVEDAYLHVYVDGQGSDTGTVNIAVQLVYHVKLMGSRLLAIS